MKFKKKDILIVGIVFLFSLILVMSGIVEIEYRYEPQSSKAIKISGITRFDLALDMFGKKIPDSKVKVYNSMVAEKEKIDYSKADSLTPAQNIELILFLSSFLTVIITVPYYSIRAKAIRKRLLKKDQELKRQYILRYNLKNKNYYITCIDSSSFDTQLSGKTLIVWKEENCISLVNKDFKDDIGIININFEDIICFSRFGDFYTSMNISGGDSSYGRAALGYLLAGPSGAIIASRRNISGKSEVHDNRETLIFIKNDDEEKYIFFEPEFYDFLMHTIPNKEINHIINIDTKVSKNSKLDELSKLAELKEKGIIDDVEFSKLKSELINL